MYTNLPVDGPVTMFSALTMFSTFFNAWRSLIPLVILCCQQQNELVTQEPPLASNLVDLASQYTKWTQGWVEGALDSADSVLGRPGIGLL